MKIIDHQFIWSISTKIRACVNLLNFVNNNKTIAIAFNSISFVTLVFRRTKSMWRSRCHCRHVGAVTPAIILLIMYCTVCEIDSKRRPT